MIDDLSCALPLTGAVKYAAAVFGGTLLGMALSRSGIASQKNMTDALMLRDSRILKTLLTALLTAIIALPFLAKLNRMPDASELHVVHMIKGWSLLPPPAAGDFWQSLFAGALTGIGLFLSGRTLLSSLAAVGKGEFHALAFLAGAVGTIVIFDECDLEPAKWCKKFDFATGVLSTRTGFDFFDPEMFCFWVTVFLAVLLVMIYVSSLFSRKGE